MGSNVVIAGTTLVAAAMALFGGAWWSYAKAVGGKIQTGVNVVIPDEIHIKAGESELAKGREEAARAYESVKRLEANQQQVDEQRAQVRREKIMYAEKLKSVKTLLDQARVKPDGTLDVAKISDEAERLMKAHDQRAQLEAKLAEQATKIEKLKKELIATAQHTLNEVERLSVQIEVAKSESHASEAKQAIAHAEQIIGQLKAHRNDADSIDKLLTELKTLGHESTDEVMMTELLSRIDSQLTR